MIAAGHIAVIATLVIALSPGTQMSAVAGNGAAPQQTATLPVPAQAGRTAEVGNGVIGQRQTRDEVAPNIRPLSRIQNRIENRVQNRLRNRIDPSYDPQADAASPFRSAEDRARAAGERDH